MRAAIYARFSTDKQDSASIADQLRVCRERAAREDWQIVAEFIDEAISGTALGNRPGARNALSAARSHQFDVLVTMEMQRLARGEDLPIIVREMIYLGVQLIGVQDGFDSNTPSARMQAGVTAIIGGEYIEMIRRRTHAALQTRALNGISAGGRPYGYTGKHEIITSEAVVVREIFARFAAGESCYEIAHSLNVRGVASPGASWRRENRRRDGRWLSSAVRAIVCNELYTGRFVWNRSQWIKDPASGIRKRRMRPRSEWIVHELPELALIDAETWQRAQSRMNRRTSHGGGKGGKPKFLLSGLLECGLCASKMIIIGGKDHRYGCSTAKGGGPHACANCRTVPRLLAEELILQPVVDDLLSPAAVEHAVKSMRQALRRNIQAVPTHELARIDQEVADVRAMMAAGRMAARRGEIVVAALEAERAGFLRSRYNLDRPPNTDELETLYRDTARALRAAFSGDDVDRARDALRALVGSIRLVPTSDHLVAHFSQGVVALLRIAGVDGMVAGAGFDAVYSPIPLKRFSRSDRK